MRILGENIIKEYIIVDDSVESIKLTNTITNQEIQLVNPNEFVIGYFNKCVFKKIKYFGASQAQLIKIEGNTLIYNFNNSDINWVIKVVNNVINGYITTNIELSNNAPDLVIDSIEYLSIELDNNLFQWSRPVPKVKTHIPPYFTALGQPVYYKDMFFGVESMTADNAIEDGKMSLKYYLGRSLKTLGKDYKFVSYVMGGGIAGNMIDLQNAFYKYVATFARPNKFRLQYNSWYDNMLDITPENIASSFTSIAKKFKDSGLRDLDCYVVDDGWVDYKKSVFWAFNNKFPNEFYKEAELVKSLGSTFGVWFGPIGGYSETFKYAKNLKKIGYNVNAPYAQICVADPNYVEDLTNRMIEFVKKFNVSYFKIDGFAIGVCGNSHHGHPVGGYKNLYFYTYQWELWMNSFAKIREICPDIFLNVTSHSNCSAWLLKEADSVWINNSGDMNYEGEGSNLDQCLNYRDGRYYDFTTVRQLQFPLAYIYNHEPCYAERNYNPPLPNPSHKTVVYNDQEFEKYLYMCMMRGTGFVELYYSPSMMTEGILKANAKVLKWAEDNYSIIKSVKYFGGIPKKKCVYGYIGFVGNDGIVAIRNSSDKVMNYTLNLTEYSSIAENPSQELVFGSLDDIKITNGNLIAELKPFEVKIIKLKY